MTSQAIIESEMTFGPYPDGHCFYIEKSKCYEEIQEGVQMAEFLLLRKNGNAASAIWVIEAKSSSPRQSTESDAKSKFKSAFDEFIEGIRVKLTNAFLLMVAARLGRQATAKEELPEPFKTLDLADTDFKFVLVIRAHKKDWLPPLQDALKLAFVPVIKTWGLPATSVAVLNDDLAKIHGLILPQVE